MRLLVCLVVALFATCLSASGQGNVYYVDSKVKLKELNPLIGRGLSFSRVVQLYDPSDPNAYGFYIATNSIAGVDDVNVIRSAHTDTYSWIRIDQVPLATDSVYGKFRLFSPAADPADPVGYDKGDTDALIDALPTKSTELSDFDFSALSTNRTQVTPLMVLSGGAQTHLPAQLWVSTIAEMQAIDPDEFANTTVFVMDPYRGGMFNRVATSGVTTNTGTMFVSSADGDYSWQRIFSGNVDVKWFGAVGDGTTDDTAAIQAAWDYAQETRKTLWLSSSTNRYRVVPANGRTNYYDTVSTINQRMARSGYIAAGFDYIVQGSAGTINYRGTNHSIGTTITGAHGHRGYARQTRVDSVDIVSGGTGYSVSDVLTLDLSGGTGTPATLTVDSVSGGVITAVSITTGGDYTTPSTDETAVAVTGGAGSGATFDITQDGHATYDAALVPVFDVAIWSTNYYAAIVGDGVAGSQILVDGPGVGIGILGTYPGTDPGDPTWVSIRDIGIWGDETSEGQIGIFMQHCTFFGKMSAHINRTRIGAIFNNCWNLHIENLTMSGAGYMDWGFQGWNANQFKVDHVFTHNYRYCIEVDTSTSHGASVDDVVHVRETKSYEYEGTVVEVIDSDTMLILVESVDDSPDLSTDEVLLDPDGAATSLTLAGGRIVGGIGAAVNSLEGFWMEGSFQNSGEAGVILYSNDDAGGIGPVQIFGNIEGPANGFIAERVPFDTQGYLHGLDIKGSVFGGSFNGRSEFGERHAVKLDYVKGSRISNGYFTSRNSTGEASNYCVYVMDTCRDVEIGLNYYDHSVGANKVSNNQPRPILKGSEVVMFNAIQAPILNAQTNITSNTSVLTLTPLKYARTENQNNNDNEARPIQYVLLKMYITPSVVGGSGRVAGKLTGADIHVDNAQLPVFVPYTAAYAGSKHEATTIYPVSEDGTINVQWNVDSGWTVSCELRQIGAIY